VTDWGFLRDHFFYMKIILNISPKVNPSATRPEGWGLLRVDPERRFSTPPSKPGLGAVERVNSNF
jgi:hypothetical protein